MAPASLSNPRLDRWIRIMSIAAVIAMIVAFVNENPDLVERGYSWPEIRRLAEGE